MKERALTPLLPPGVLRVHSPHTINTFSSKEEVAKKTRDLNQGDKLDWAFFDPANKDILAMSTVGETTVSIFDPNGPYHPDSVMIIAKTPKMLIGNPIGTYHVYELPFDGQQEYWRIVRETLRFNPGSYYCENASSQFSNEEHRTPRTIGLPHGQIGKVDPTKIEAFPEGVDLNTPEFLEEVATLKSHPLAREALLSIHSSLKELYPKNDSSLSWRMYGRASELALPVGYSLLLKGPIDDKSFAHFMNANFYAYSRAVFKLFATIKLPQEELDRFMPQPSFRLFVEKVDSKMDKGLFITVAPHVYSHAGVNEVAGLFLDRDPKYNPLVAPQDREKYLQEYTAYIKKVLAIATGPR